MRIAAQNLRRGEWGSPVSVESQFEDSDMEEQVTRTAEGKIKET